MSRFCTDRLAALSPYTPGEQPTSFDGVVKLNTNENPYPPAPGVLSAVRAEPAELLRRYPPPGVAALAAALAKTYGLAPEQVAVGNGSDELLGFCFYGLCKNGAAFPDVTYGFYPVWCDLWGIEKRIVPLRGDWRIDPADYAGLRETLFIANPNAPTGLALSPDRIAALLAQDRDRLVVVDEAYVDFGAASCLPLLSDFDNLLLVRTYSKSRNLAGGRLGWAMGSPAVIADLNKQIFSFNPYNVSGLSAAAGLAALADPAYFERCRQAVIAERGRMAEGLRARGFTLLPSSANFVFARPPKGDGEAVYTALKERRVLVRWFAAPRIREWLRVSVGSPDQTDRLLAALDEIL